MKAVIRPMGFWGRFARHRAGMFGLVLLLAVVVTAVLGPFAYPQDPLAMDGMPFQWPGESADFPLGTDNMGRDVLAGLIQGARISLLVGFSAALSAILLGVVVGSAAGAGPRWLDDALMRLTEVFQTMPNFLFSIVLIAIFKPSLPIVVFAISVVSWPPVARITRAQVMALRERDFVGSCRIIGMSRLRIVFTQMLPNCISPVIVLASMLVATAILTEAALAFLNLSDVNTVTWGRMIGNGRAALRQAWYLTAIPGGAILITVLALNFIGEAVNDALNPRLRHG